MYYAYHFYDADGVLVYTGFSSDLVLRLRLLHNRWPDGYLRVAETFTDWMMALDWENNRRSENYPTETVRNPKKQETRHDPEPPTSKAQIAAINKQVKQLAKQ